MFQVQTLSENPLPEYVQKAVQILKNDGVIIYPTDTLYGLGADALSDKAVEKIYAIKGRDKLKPIHAIVADLEMVERYAVVNEIARKLAQRFLPGALTLILEKKPDVTTGIARQGDTFAVRIPNNEFCIALSRAFDGPITTTSANTSGASPARSIEGILAQLAEKASYIDMAIDAGEFEERLPSTVVSVVGGEIRILREGAISSSNINSYHEKK